MLLLYLHDDLLALIATFVDATYHYALRLACTRLAHACPRAGRRVATFSCPSAYYATESLRCWVLGHDDVPMRSRETVLACARRGYCRFFGGAHPGRLASVECIEHPSVLHTILDAGLSRAQANVPLLAAVQERAYALLSTHEAAAWDVLDRLATHAPSVVHRRTFTAWARAVRASARHIAATAHELGVPERVAEEVARAYAHDVDQSWFHPEMPTAHQRACMSNLVRRADVASIRAILARDGGGASPLICFVEQCAEHAGRALAEQLLSPEALAAIRGDDAERLLGAILEAEAHDMLDLLHAHNTAFRAAYAGAVRRCNAVATAGGLHHAYGARALLRFATGHAPTMHALRVTPVHVRLVTALYGEWAHDALAASCTEPLCPVEMALVAIQHGHIRLASRYWDAVPDEMLPDVQCALREVLNCRWTCVAGSMPPSPLALYWCKRALRQPRTGVN